MRSLKQIEEGYDVFWETTADRNDDWTAIKVPIARGAAVDLIPQNCGRMLDIGCGNGMAMRLLSKRGFDAVGLDLSTSALHEARKYGEVVKGDALRLPFMDQEFGCVVMFDVFEHLVMKRKALIEVKRIMSDRGHLILTTPPAGASEGQGDPRQPYDKPCSYEEILDLIDGLFTVEYIKGFGWTPRGLRRAESLVPAKVQRVFPFVVARSSELLLVLRKDSGTANE